MFETYFSSMTVLILGMILAVVFLALWMWHRYTRRTRERFQRMVEEAKVRR